MDNKQLQSLADLAIEAALKAGAYIAQKVAIEHQVNHKKSGESLASQVVTEVDIQCDHMIREALLPSCKEWDIALLSEETPDPNRQRLHKDYFWCVDPLDGTLAFINRREGYAVSIALVSHAGEAMIGVIYDPVRQELTHAIKDQGIYRNGVAADFPNRTASTSGIFRVFADESFKQHPDHHEVDRALRQLAQGQNLTTVEYCYGMGAVKNALGVLENPSACYLKPPKTTEGGGSLWDFSASACTVKEAGGWVSNGSGNPLDLNRADSTFMNHQGVIYASNAAIAKELIALCRRFGS